MGHLQHGVCFFTGREGRSLRRILLNINLIAVAVGFLLMATGVMLPRFVGEITSSLGGMVGYVGMLIAGMTAASVDLKKVLSSLRLYTVCLMRTVICPLAVLALLKLILLVSPVSGGESILLITFLASMTPAAATVMQMSQIYDNEPKYAVSINVVSTLMACVTMPLLVLLYEAIT